MRSETDIINAVVELWHKAGCSVAEHCGYSYPKETEKDMLSFIKNLKK